MSLEKISHDADTIAQTAQIVIDRLQERNAKLVAALQELGEVVDYSIAGNYDPPIPDLQKIIHKALAQQSTEKP